MDESGSSTQEMSIDQVSPDQAFVRRPYSEKHTKFARIDFRRKATSGDRPKNLNPLKIKSTLKLSSKLGLTKLMQNAKAWVQENPRGKFTCLRENTANKSRQLYPEDKKKRCMHTQSPLVCKANGLNGMDAAPRYCHGKP